ncbi:MAG: heavy-metal-associated domain-containing protein [Ignavibacteriae bacterium]|nr:heavy-metal-associated domain-containing protein [Ignavibacteriota bacterium]
MKTKTISLLTVVLIALFLNINSVHATANDIQHSKTITIKLNSMQCDMCVEKVTEAINSVEGVEKVSVDLDKKNATVTFNSDVTSKKAIEKAITSAGYDANNKKADPEAYDNLSGCCKKP